MLFKHINQVQVAMSPFNVSSRSARYVFTAKSGYESSGWLAPWAQLKLTLLTLPVRLFLNRVQTDAAKKANPALKINTQVLSDPKAKSKIDIAYRELLREHQWI